MVNMKGRFFIGIIMSLMLLTGMIPSTLPVAVAAPSTAITITKYTCDGTTVLDQTTVDYVWMEANLAVWGDGVSHYYHQGPTLDPANLLDSGIAPEPAPGETVNVDSSDLGAAVGTDVRDLCAQVGGAPAGSRIEIKAVDNFSKSFAADDINSMVGIRPVIAWYNGTYGGYVPDYSAGMRLIFVDETTNVDGKHVFGNWDMHETISDTYWAYYNDGSTLWPSSKGLSVKNVDRIDIFTDECAAAPVDGCVSPQKGILLVNEKVPGKEKLKVGLKKLREAVSQSDFGDPVGGETVYTVCVYDDADSLVGEMLVVQAQENCGPKSKPCWKAISDQGYKYKDPDTTADGILSIVAKGGDAGKGKVIAVGKNGAGKLPTGIAAALLNNTKATVQVVTSDAACFGVTATEVKKADGLLFKAVGGSPSRAFLDVSSGLLD